MPTHSNADLMAAPLVVVRSASDIGSAAAHALKGAGFAPLLLERAEPGATRRRMSFAGAVFTGQAELEGQRAVRCASPEETAAMADEVNVIPLLVLNREDDAPAVLETLGKLRPVAALVDARMRKKARPEGQMHLATFVVGIGPGFIAGEQAHVVVESNWGDRLGHVIHTGGAEEYTGQHRVIAGKGAERYVYSPVAGRFDTAMDVGGVVREGSTVATVDGTPLRVESAGILRGLAYPGVHVAAGAKVAEVDPTGDPANCAGIAARPAAIAWGVVQALRERLSAE